MEIADVLDRIASEPIAKVGDGTSESKIASAEGTLGLLFDHDYRSFLRRFGWADLGSVEVNGLGADVPHWLDVVESTIDRRAQAHPLLSHNLLPVMEDGFGNAYCIDLSDELDERGRVVFWDHEDVDGPDQTPVHVAPRFADFLNYMLDEEIAAL